jgi:chlorite dismutase
MQPLTVEFVGGDAGEWQVASITEVRGEGLPAAARMSVLEGPNAAGYPPAAAWVLRGVTSNERYVKLAEQEALRARTPALGRPEATAAALIPIKKSQEWWELAQDERRAIFEEQSRHIATSLAYLPRVARRLHHGRDLGEPFDFLTWFEYAPEHEGAFEELVGLLRATEEWRYVIREVDVRVVHTDP